MLFPIDCAAVHVDQKRIRGTSTYLLISNFQFIMRAKHVSSGDTFLKNNTYAIAQAGPLGRQLIMIFAINFQLSKQRGIDSFPFPGLLDQLISSFPF